MTLTLTLTPDKETRLQAQARRAGLSPEEYVQRLIDHDTEAPGEDDEQERLHALMAQAITEANELEPDPADSPTRRASRENPAAQAVAMKFRRQGFNL